MHDGIAAGNAEREYAVFCSLPAQIQPFPGGELPAAANGLNALRRQVDVAHAAAKAAAGGEFKHGVYRNALLIGFFSHNGADNPPGPIDSHAHVERSFLPRSLALA